MTKPYSELTVHGQARRLRRMALAALERYDLDVRRVRLLTNDLNGIFRVDTAEGDKFILRISVAGPGAHTLEQIRSEMMWLAALRRDTDLSVPEPLPTRTGELVTTVEVEGVPEPRHCVIFGWVPGPDLADRLTPDNVARLGEFAARLHEHAATFRPPDGFQIYTFDKVFPFNEPVVIFEEAHRDLFPPSRQEIFRRAIDRVQREIDKLHADPSELRVIHNDLHQWNTKVYRGRISALDFEDMMLGHPVQDIAATLYYHRWEPGYPVMRDAYVRGYTRHSEWPEQHPGQIEALFAGQAVILANYIVHDQNPEWRQKAPSFIEVMEGRIRVFLDGDTT